MEERAAFITSGTAELKRRLADFINDKPAVTGRFRGENSRRKILPGFLMMMTALNSLRNGLRKEKDRSSVKCGVKASPSIGTSFTKTSIRNESACRSTRLQRSRTGRKSRKEHICRTHRSLSFTPARATKYVRFGRSAVQLTVYRLRIFPEGSCGQGKAVLAGSGIFGNVL